jgi:hypothetical protein
MEVEKLDSPSWAKVDFLKTRNQKKKNGDQRSNI